MALLDNASSFLLFMVSIIKREIINFEIHLIVDYAFFFGSIQYELCPCISYLQMLWNHFNSREAMYVDDKVFTCSRVRNAVGKIDIQTCSWVRVWFKKSRDLTPTPQTNNVFEKNSWVHLRWRCFLNMDSSPWADDWDFAGTQMNNVFADIKISFVG